MKITVIGAGVAGLTTAVRALEEGHQVRVLTASRPEGTTSSVAGAMCGPTIPDQPTSRWQSVSEKKFRALAEDPKTGVKIRRGRLLSAPSMGRSIPPWANGVDGFQLCSPDELPSADEKGFWGNVPFADMAKYLPWLEREVAAKGGSIEQQVVTSFDAIEGEVIVNCAGLGASSLTVDPYLEPIRGQYVVVQAPWITEFTFEASLEDFFLCVVPHDDRVLLGGVVQRGSRSLLPDEALTKRIFDRCVQAVPSLRDAKIIGFEVGVRPGRTGVRLEREGRVIHNYGHGAVGVQLSWGCAEDVVNLVKEETNAGNSDFPSP